MVGIADIRLRLAVAAVFGIWFWIIFFGCDYAARSFEYRHSVATWLDAAIPFLPQFAIVYMGVNIMLFLPLFVIRDTARVLALAVTMAAEVAVAGVIYMVYPVEAAVTPQYSGSAMLGMADTVNLTYNCFPSLHVALTVSTVWAMSPDLRPLPRALMWIATAMIAISTVLTKQHFVADAISGLLLAAIAMAFLFQPLVRKAASRFR
ncbi:MAG: phosphatase PAP2 family protein [Salaquimonas sp.]|nr:phosphatase PAP2 family protein [Salaquimonas sp.]